MAQKTAVQPKLSLAQMIDMRIDICQQIEALEVSKKALGEKIVAEMQGAGMKKAFGTRGKGYRLDELLKAEYTQKAVEYVKEQGIAALFQAEPRITRSKVFDALKAQLISDSQFSRLQSLVAREFTEYVLKTIDGGEVLV